MYVFNFAILWNLYDFKVIQTRVPPALSSIVPTQKNFGGENYMLGVFFLQFHIFAFSDSAAHPKYTYEILEKSKIGNKNYGASKG